MAKLINKGRRGLGFPSRARRNATVPSFLLKSGASKVVPDWYVEELGKLKGMRARVERSEIAIMEDGFNGDSKRGEKEGQEPAPSPPAADSSVVRPETLKGIAVPDAGTLIAEETDLDVLERWAADERVTIQRLVTDRIEELTTPD